MRRMAGAAAALALLSMLAGCRITSTGAVRIDPALEVLVPSDTVLLAGANIEKIRGTRFYQEFLSRVNPAELDSFVTLTGLDPRKDIWEIVSCSNGKNGLLLARGKFSLDGGEPRVPAQLPHFGYRGYTLYGDERAAIWFVSLTTVAVAPEPVIRALIDGRDATRHGIPPALVTQLEAVPASSQAWAVFAGDLTALRTGVPTGGNLGNLIQIVRGINGIALGIDLRSGLDLAARVSCRDEDSARHVHDATRGVIGMGRLSTPDNHPEMLKVYDAIQVAQSGTVVNVTAKLPQELIDQFLSVWLPKG